MSNEFTLTPEEGAALHRLMGTRPPRDVRNPLRVVVLWLAMIAGFIALYRTFSGPRVEGPGTSTAEHVLMALSVLSVVAGWITASVIEEPRRELTGGHSVFATVDGIEVERGGRRGIYPWPQVTEVRVDAQLAAMKIGKTWTVVPLRAFDADERAQFLAALEAKASALDPPGVDAPCHRYVLTTQQVRQALELYWQWWGQLALRRVFLATVLAFGVSTTALAVMHSPWWLVGTVATLLVLRKSLGAWWRAREQRESKRSLWVGSSLRVIADDTGAQIPWADVSGWGETDELLLVWDGAFLVTVPLGAVPAAVLEALRERLRHLPAKKEARSPGRRPSE